MDRISTLDDGYLLGDLSLYPKAYDTLDQLYHATNNAETNLKQALAYNANKIIVNDATNFPDKGILRIGTKPGKAGTHELVFFDTKAGNVFVNVIRGFAGSTQNRWPIEAPVTAGVMAEHHNAVRDSTHNIEANLGTKLFPATESLNWILKNLEQKWLSPRPSFRIFPRTGPAPLTVRFQNYSVNNTVRYLWDFGDGAQSTEKSPTHVFASEGVYTITLNIITRTGGTGTITKTNYITVDNSEITPFFYVIPHDGSSKIYSIQTANKLGEQPAVFDFVDQTDGDVVQRFWVFDDGETAEISDPNQHTTTHIYAEPGEYEPSLLLVLSNKKIKRAFLSETLTVL